MQKVSKFLIENQINVTGDPFYEVVYSYSFNFCETTEISSYNF